MGRAFVTVDSGLLLPAFGAGKGCCRDCLTLPRFLPAIEHSNPRCSQRLGFFARRCGALGLWVGVAALRCTWGFWCARFCGVAGLWVGVVDLWRAGALGACSGAWLLSCVLGVSGGMLSFFLFENVQIDGTGQVETGFLRLPTQFETRDLGFCWERSERRVPNCFFCILDLPRTVNLRVFCALFSTRCRLRGWDCDCIDTFKAAEECPARVRGGMDTRDCVRGYPLLENRGQTRANRRYSVVESPFLSKHASIPQNCGFTPFGDLGGSANRRRPRFVFLCADSRAGRCAQLAFWGLCF